jgi:putative ABC transport system permease protein
LEKGTRSPESFMIDHPEQIAARIEDMPAVQSVMSRLLFSGLINNGKRDVAVIGEGIDISKENKLGTQLRIASGRELRSTDLQGILVGQGVASTLNLVPGSSVTLLMSAAGGVMNTADFTVVGVFQSFSKEFDARAIRIGRAAAQEALLTSGANLVVIQLDDTSQTAAVADTIRAALPPGLEAREWYRLSDFYEKAVKLYDQQFRVLQTIVVIMVLLSVVNSVNMSAFERQSEFGTMLAMGTNRRTVSELILLEGVILGLIGSSLGVGVGLSVAAAISAIGIPMPPPPNANIGYVAAIQIEAGNICIAFVIGLFATIIAGTLPAFKISRTPVVDSLRQSI